ncbi:MAG: ABC transporter substrate-binding protein [Actinomycetota bacterium]
MLFAPALIASACSSSDTTASSAGANDDASSNASDASEETEESPSSDTDESSSTGTEEPGDAVEAEPEPTTRIVSTSFGDFEVPTDPRRVVVLNSSLDLPTALDVGANVIGTLSFSGEKPATSLVSDEEWAALEILGTSVETSLERIVAAEPDLVLVPPNSEEEFELYADAVTSVPIVLTNRWQDDARNVADALNKVDEIDELLDDYNARATDLGQRIRAEHGDTTIAFLRIRPGSLRIHTSVHFAGNVLDDVGLSMPEMWRREVLDDPVANIMQRVEVISPEQVGLLSDADHIFVTVQGTAAQSEAEVQQAADDILGSALWATLPAVQTGQVNFVEGYWIAGTLRAADAALGDLEAYFFG